MIYFWLKALHIIAVLVWFSALLYLPRLFVYYAGAKEQPTREMLALMASRLYRIIMNTGVAAVFITGLAVIWVNPGVLIQGWFHIKFALVLVLLVYHIFCGRFVRHMTAKKDLRSESFHRLFNEIPTLFLIVIVILAVVKPF